MDRVQVSHTNVSDKYVFFWNGPLSQWQHSEFDLDGVRFVSAEQAMMYFKAMLFEDGEIAERILAADDPGRQKALGRQVRGFDEKTWQDERERIVCRVNLAKFRQNKGLRRKLFHTGNRLLVEASPVDTIWGIGLDAEQARQTPPNEWPGRNLLGQILTDVRQILRSEFPHERVFEPAEPENDHETT